MPRLLVFQFLALILYARRFPMKQRTVEENKKIQTLYMQTSSPFLTRVLFDLMPCHWSTTLSMSGDDLNESSLQVCSSYLDPHYTSFDQLHFDYHGICKYNLASYCGKSKSLLGFQIFAKNEHRYGHTTISWPQYVEIHFVGHTVLLGKNPTVIEVNIY
jgi:von Willebrand factor type D domain